jgi:hypothetical protein
MARELKPKIDHKISSTKGPDVAKITTKTKYRLEVAANSIIVVEEITIVMR